MYSPSYYREERLDLILKLIEEVSFATVLTEGNTDLISHLPVQLTFDNGGRSVRKNYFTKWRPRASFAGEGSTLDFLITANYGYSNGCSELDKTDDKLRHTACELGASMKAAGLTKKQADAVLETAAENMTQFDSICK